MHASGWGTGLQEYKKNGIVTVNALIAFLRYPRKKQYQYGLNHRLSINRLTKRGKEMAPSDGHCQCEKEMDDHLLACQQILERELLSDTHCQ
jgi:hypothetical protein